MNYDLFAHTFSQSRKNLHWPELDAIIEDMKEQKIESILDIGCGNGRFLENGEWGMVNGEYRYLGVDNSAKMIEEARKLHLDHDFRVCPMESLGTLNFEPGTFDAIVLLASFHHLETRQKRRETLESMRTYLTPGGHIYMTNWNLRDQPKYDTMKTSDGEYQIKIGAHSRYYHGFTLDELAGLFHETGYTLREHRIYEGGRNLYSIITHG